MDVLTDIITKDAPTALAVGGLIIGFAFGWIVFATNFCTMGSISDFMSFGDFRRFRAWVLAGAVALIGTQMLQMAGLVDLSKSMYLTASFNWFGNLVGGLMFGFGMVLAGGCASKNLARLGGGDLRALVTLLVIALFAYMAMGGLLGPIRNWLDQTTAINLANLKIGTQGLGTVANHYLGLSVARADVVLALAIAGLALLYCFADAAFRGSPVQVWSGIGVGLCVVAGWALTGLAFDELAERPTAPISLTYVRPTGDTVEWLQRFTAARIPGFGVATVLGAILGAFVAAKASGRFQLTTFADVRDMLRNLGGAALMGVGGVMALGCTIGQAVTGISTLAAGSFVTFAAIVFGGIAGMKYMERLLVADV
ncbi:MAG: YeeE/YedE family protein [Hyphomicrobiaceae bacterium]|nr:MAG: YeeE/YedE family protein [Hyphomicrobiaceae bacterium]